MREIVRVKNLKMMRLGERRSGWPLEAESVRMQAFGCSFENVQFFVTVEASTND